MKKIISVILVIAMLLCAFPMSYAVSADDIEENQFSDLIEEVYYTDLFSVYSQYLLDDGLTDTMDEELQEALITVYKNLENSEKYYDIVNKHALTNIGDISFLVKLVSDATGATNFTYNEALDTANQLLVNSMFNKSYVSDHVQSNSRTAKVINICKELVVELIKDVKIIHQKEIDVISLADILNVVKSDEGKYYSYYSHYYHKWGVKEVVDYCSVNVDAVQGIFSAGTTGIEMFSAIILAFSMEMMRAEIIEDLIAVSDEGSAINDGMSRLATQLVDGAASYFIHNYLKKEGIKRFENAVDTFVSDKVLDSVVPDASFVLTVVNIAATITYDLILDVPDFSELTAYIILSRYSQELAQCIKKMENDFTCTTLTGHSITRYENLWCVYNAANKAAWKLGNELAVEKDKDTLDFAFTTYYTPDIDFYTEKMNFVIEKVEKIPVEERNVIPPSAYAYNLSSLDCDFKDATNEMVEDNCIYTVNGYLYGDAKVYGNCDMSVLQDTKGVYGSVVIRGSTLTVSAESEYTVGGDVLLTGYWSGGSNYEGILSLNGKLTVYGDVYSDTDYTQYDFYMSEDGELWLHGDYSLSYISHMYGTVVCDGKKQQSLNGEFSNITVYNPEGVTGSIVLKGYFELNNNPHSGTITLRNGGCFDESKFDRVYVNQDCILRSNINADEVEVYGSVLSVPVGSAYTINADVNLGGYISGSYYKKGTLEIYGDLTVTGDINKVTDNPYYELKLLNENAVLHLLGNQNIGLSNTYYGTVVFEGDEKQIMTGSYNNIVVTNSEGVEGDIVLEGNFRLNNNPHSGSVTLRNGGSFDDSRFDRVYVNQDCILRSNINADEVEVYGAVLSAPVGSAYTINADVNLGGYISGSYYKKGTLEIYGDLTVTGDINKVTDNPYYELKLLNENAVLHLLGNQNIGLSNTYYGTVVFEGDEKQIMTGSYNNIVVTNSEGVEGNIVLEGNFRLNNNPHSGSVTLHNGGSFDDSKFDRVYVNTDCILKSNISANEVEIYGKTLTVTKNSAYTIDADIFLGGYIGGTYINYGTLEVIGDLTVTGNITNIAGNNYYKIIANDSDSVIRFAGEGAQTVGCALNAGRVIIENESDEGVIFESSCSANTLFDHNRNNYVINGTGSFTDYDNDGILDNEDMVPEAARGDANADGIVNALDSFVVSRIVAGSADVMSFESVYNSDINEDGTVNSMDSNIMKRRLVGV